MGRIKNIVGQKFGTLTVIGPYFKEKSSDGKRVYILWPVRCDCGVEKYMRRCNLLTAKSCGCKSPHPPVQKYKNRTAALEKKIFNTYKKKAKERFIEFDLTIKDFVLLIYNECGYCGLGHSLEKKDNISEELIKYNGIDRIDNSLGYKKYNCISCCKFCNIAKNDYSEDFFIEKIKKIIHYRRLGVVRSGMITGVDGQDGSFLAEILLEKGYSVIGLARRGSGKTFDRIKHLFDNPNFKLEYCDITDSSRIYNLVKQYKPSEFYNLAAMSFVGDSWKMPSATSQVTGIGALNCLESIHLAGTKTRFYQACSSEQFGRVLETPQTEITRQNPLSPYAAAKCFAFNMTKIYRESYDMFACAGLLFNHESDRRSIEFVTKKITQAAAKIKLGLQDRLELGNLDAKRDWGHAKDYCMAMWLMLQQDVPDDYVIATGKTYSIRDLLDVAFGHLDLDWRDYVIQNPKYMRPNDVNLLLGDSTKARKQLDWQPKYDFKMLIEEMVASDYARLSAT